MREGDVQPIPAVHMATAVMSFGTEAPTPASPSDDAEVTRTPDEAQQNPGMVPQTCEESAGSRGTVTHHFSIAAGRASAVRAV